MSKQKKFTIKADATFLAKDMDSVFTKLGKYFLSLGSKKEDKEFENILESGEIVVCNKDDEHTYKD